MIYNYFYYYYIILYTHVANIIHFVIDQSVSARLSKDTIFGIPLLFLFYKYCNAILFLLMILMIIL